MKITESNGQEIVVTDLAVAIAQAASLLDRYIRQAESITGQ